MTGGLASTMMLRPAAALHHLAARPGADPDVPVTTPRLPAREDAERELSEPRYHENDPGLLQRLLDWVWKHVNDLLRSATDAAPGGWTGLAVIAVLLVLIALAVRLRLGKLRAQPTTDAAGLFPRRKQSAADHRAASQAHATAEHWNEAVQERMRAVVRSLEERAVLDPRPGRTADEAASEAGQAFPDHSGELLAAAHVFDEVTYGSQQADESAYTRVRDLDNALQVNTPVLDRPDRRQTASVPGGGHE